MSMTAYHSEPQDQAPRSFVGYGVGVETFFSYRLTLPHRARHCTNLWSVVFVSLRGGSVSGSSVTWTPSSVRTSIKPSTLEPTATTHMHSTCCKEESGSTGRPRASNASIADLS